MFDDAVEVIQVHETDVRPDVAQSIIEVSKLYYIKEQKLAKARSLFKNDDEVLEYMDDRDLNAPRASFHEEREEFDDAAECHLREGDDLKAIKLFLLNYRKRQSAQSLLRAVTCILDGLWLYMSLGAPEGNWEDQKLVEILGHAEVVFPRLQDGILRNEIAMFRAIWQNDIPALAELGEWFHTRDEHHPAGLLCLDHVFAHDFGLESAALSEIASCFQTFLVYARTLSRYSCDPNPCQNSHIQKLFTFRRVNSDNEELFFLPKGSYLFSRALDGGATILEETTAQGIYILRWNLERLAKTALRERLKDRVLNQNEICHKLLCLRPCLLYATNQFCPRRGCPQLHIDPSPKEARATYNNLIRIHVLHIMIFHTLYATDIPYLILDKQRKAWLRRLYEALYPVSDNIGSLHTLTLASIPELTTGRHIIAVWIQDSLNRFDHDKDPAHIFLVNLMRTTRLAMLLDRRAAFSQLQRIPCAIRDREKRPQYLVRWGDRYIVNDLIAAMQCGYPGALDRGVQFLNHVLYNRLQVDIGVLCDFMDQLCGAMLISLHLRNKGTLHGLTLPKSWLVRLLQDTDQLATMKTEKSPKYVACMNQLLRDICTGNKASHLLFENLNMSSRGLNMTREVFIEKICRNICFWGLNLPIPQLRQWIHQTISGLQHVGRDIMSHTSSAYIYAEDWHSLAQAAVKSVASSSLDEVVYLCCSASDPPRSPPNVRLVRYQNIEDLISLLDATHIVQLSCNTADVKADSRTNASGGPLPASRPSDYDSQPMTGTTAVLSEESNAEDEDNEQHQVEFTDIQITAASKIISTYRGYIQRKAFEKDQLTEMRRRVYEDFLTTSPTIERRGSPYRFLFLGIVPNLFAVTECLKDHMYKAKSSAKESLRNAHDRELEDVQAALDDASRLFKEACRLHKALAPSATVHKSRDVQKLQEHALAVESLVKQLEDAISADSDVTFPWMEDWRLYELAYHALVKATSQLEEA
ncbi:hypothetical protein BD310DRAFT_938092 [Dichomitus squalens]|uniref:Uncharacterized protein n=1 Tax=Dichomitus squalens TaxID=114155 RepID=A0A4Q9PHX6_9APHY|nr:hypothetical protein BD310DRAFT_938092 [Dichomitus squalens]